MSEVQLKRKVTLKEKKSSSAPDVSYNKKRLWPWILLAILVVVGIVIAIVLTKDNNKAEGSEVVTPTEQTEEHVSAQTEASIAEETDTPSDAVAEPAEETAVEEPVATAPVPVAAPKPIAEPQPTVTTAASNGLTGDIEKDARLVIQGKFQNYPERKQLIEAAGGNYEQIQSRVNEIYREKYSN